MLVCVLLGEYDLLPHVNINITVMDRTPSSTREDYVIQSWLYGSISDEILSIIMTEEHTVHEMTRVVYLETEFPSLVQGDRSVTAYCHRLKVVSDALGHVDTRIFDQTLVLNCLCGLNSRFSDITTIVTMQSTMSSFTHTGSLLTLRETAHELLGSGKPDRALQRYSIP
ncbi:hypothetical protein ZWY2020_033411 [Hordeum vulgare]|nr:hypothetical protein ZWY2020_033411 [Hordeum vulgare]